ncbi:DinB family protein [Fodinibius sediminis]|uniref:DinB superfamily protein n=1 Tax=Fodinibius sediminis TaxID=1214077 RepID=A0A521BGC7_9BACT|nr:DinB family protein [Fodinibius sediminis]SMO46167.1 DinB superfamily protein [Fodinibius sediminis]
MKNAMLTQFDLHQQLYNNVLDGFSDAESNRRLHGNRQMNHVKYLAGHLLDSQYGLALIAGVDVTPRWQELFAGRGQSEARDDAPYPELEDIKTEWNSLYKPVRQGLSSIAPQELNSTPPKPFDQVARSTGELWAFINHHVAYHIGQIGILRRGFGKESMQYT